MWRERRWLLVSLNSWIKLSILVKVIRKMRNLRKLQKDRQPRSLQFKRTTQYHQRAILWQWKATIKVKRALLKILWRTCSELTNHWRSGSNLNVFKISNQFIPTTIHRGSPKLGNSINRMIRLLFNRII